VLHLPQTGPPQGVSEPVGNFWAGLQISLDYGFTKIYNILL
jgi:hypothetical protein